MSRAKRSNNPGSWEWPELAGLQSKRWSTMRWSTPGPRAIDLINTRQSLNYIDSEWRPGSLTLGDWISGAFASSRRAARKPSRIFSI